MGKRVVVSVPESQDALTTPAKSIRKKKRSTINSATVGKALRLNAANNYWHENDDEDSSSNDAPATLGRVQSSKQANNSSILLNSSLDISINESPKPVYTLRPSVVNGTILHDLAQKPWRLGRPIGKGNFGEIFLASNDITVPVTNENAKFVVKIEPHSNGPLFVEIHCLMNTAKKDSDEQEGSISSRLSQIPPSGIPDYIASGSHYFGNARYRFLVLQRFDRDLHSLIKNCRVSQKSVLTLAIQIINVLEKLHDKGYCHNDVKAQNLMISKCKYYKKLQQIDATGIEKNDASAIKSKFIEQDDEKQQTTDSGNSSEQEANDDEDGGYIKSKGRKYNKCGDIDEDSEDFDDDATSHSNNSNSMDIYETPVYKRKRRARNAIVEFSGSNPVRSCRRQQRNSIYEEMVKSHYLRPAKRISYSEFFNEDTSVKGDTTPDIQLITSDDESEEFLPQRNKRTTSKQRLFPSSASVRRLTRQQEKLSVSSVNQQHSHQTNPATNRIEYMVPQFKAVEEERIVLIDFGLASKFMDNGVHRPFVMDQRRAHDGTLEFTSRDAHMGAHSRRSDLECLGYNLIFWSQGYLPWKEAATQHQQEKVHRAKEYLMTDVREMLKQIYGKQAPKFLGEFLHHVGQLAYHERPDYARYRRIFEREYQQLGYSLEDMSLDGHEIVRTCVRFKEEIENTKDIFEMNKNVLSIMKNLTVGTPFHERTFSNRVSPKNLRSKSDKKAPKKKKFSWAEILSQDPDQIARERAEKEFDREDELSDIHHPTVRRYEGKPTYAILEVQQKMKMNGRLVPEDQKHGLLRDMNREINTDIKEEDDFIDNEDQDDNDTGNEEADENESHDEDIESDVTEASEDPQPFHKNKRSKAVKTSLKKSSIENSKSVTTSTSRKSLVCKSRSSKTTSATTRTRSATTIVIKTNTVSSSKRGSATRNNRKSGGVVTNSQSAASAAGEVEQSETKYHNIDNGGSGVRTHGKPSERRTRRCLIKTDAEKVTEEEGNSNFSPDVRSLFNVWNKINDKSIYFKGSNNAASASAKHCRK